MSEPTTEVLVWRDRLRCDTTTPCAYDHTCANHKVLAEVTEALAQQREEVTEWEHLEALQRRREQPWIERWQAEMGKPNTLPDYGEFLGWLVTMLDAARAELAVPDGVKKKSWGSSGE